MLTYNLNHEYLSIHGVANKKLEELNAMGINVIKYHINNISNRDTLYITVSEEDEFFLTLGDNI